VSWKYVKLGSLVELITKGTTPTSVGYSFSEKGINFVKIESIDSLGKFLPNKFAKINAECNEALKRSQLKENDILFSIAGALGRTAIVTKEILPANTNQALAIIRLKDEYSISKEFLYRVLASEGIINQISQMKGGVAQQNLSLTQLKDFLVPLPPLQIQQKIVIKLDAIFTEIGKATAAAEANAKNAEALFQSYLTEVFERNGDGWERKQLSDIARVTNGYAFKSGDFISDDGIKCIKIANVGIKDFVCETNEFLPIDYAIKHPNFLVSEGAIVIPLTRTIIGGGLKVAIVPKEFDGSLLNQRVAAINAIPSLMDGELIYFYLSSSIVSSYVLSNVNALMQPNLSIKDLLRLPIPVPPLKIQNNIKNDIKNGIDAINKIKEKNIKKIKSYLTLKNSILQQALNGELVKD
jgi:type I restriction enzyme S subunit